MLGEVGTLAWTRRTNGLLSRSERARYIAATVRETARRAPSLTAWRLGRDGKGEIGEDSLKLPPTVGPEQGTEAHLLHDGVLILDRASREQRKEAIRTLREMEQSEEAA